MRTENYLSLAWCHLDIHLRRNRSKVITNNLCNFFLHQIPGFKQDEGAKPDPELLVPVISIPLFYLNRDDICGMFWPNLIYSAIISVLLPHSYQYLSWMSWSFHPQTISFQGERVSLLLLANFNLFCTYPALGQTAEPRPQEGWTAEPGPQGGPKSLLN